MCSSFKINITYHYLVPYLDPSRDTHTQETRIRKVFEET
jgi:hypothetical protein